ncbi:hypothetical protein [Micromonospora sp. NPDC049301]|uniref:hypothetical protein n=1 Tax=Micromonospora sp. NPDC049301 TaxID=3155723 RepID=UPI003449D1EC
MISRESFAGWYRNRLVWVVVILLAVLAGTVVLVNRAEPEAEPADLQAQIVARMRTTLEQADPGQHNHAGHSAQQGDTAEKPPVICGVRVYGYEPAEATALADVQKVYGFHLCGVAEQKRPWDVAVKLAGPVIMDMSTHPPGIQVVEATADVMFVDRLREMFPAKYATLAQKEALTAAEMADQRRRYDAAAGL